MSTPLLKTLNLEIRIPYSDTPYFLQLHSSSTVSHLKSKLFRKTSSLQGRKLDSYSLAIKREHEDSYDVLHEDRKVVKSHPSIEDEYHQNKLVTLHLIRSIDLHNDMSPKGLGLGLGMGMSQGLNRGSSDQFKTGPLTTPSRYSLISPQGVPAPVQFSPPAHTLLVRSKSEPSIRRSLSNSLTNLPLNSSPSSGYSSILANSVASNADFGGEETGSEALSSHCDDSDTESMDLSDDEREQSLAVISSLLPSPPPPPMLPPPSPGFSRPRSSTSESQNPPLIPTKALTTDKPDSGGKNDKKKVKKEKKDKHSGGHSWLWRRDDKEKPKDKKEVSPIDYGTTKRLSIKIPHLMSNHPTLSIHVPSPASQTPHHAHTHSFGNHHFLTHETSSSSLKSYSTTSSSFSSNSSHSDINSPPPTPISSSVPNSHSFSPPYTASFSSAPTSAPVNLTSPQTSPITPPLTPTPPRPNQSNSNIKFHAQTVLPVHMPPPPTPPKQPCLDTDLSNKKGNPGLIVEEDTSAGKITVVAGYVDELINCLADRDIPDRTYCDTFLCTLNYFSTTEYVLRKLFERYEYAGEGPSFAQWRPMIQTRVLKVLRSALESYQFLFLKNPALLGELRKFLEAVRHVHPNKMAVRELDTLLKATPQASPKALARTNSGSNCSTPGTSPPTLERSTSSSFISLAVSHGSSSSSSLASSASSSPNGSPEAAHTALMNTILEPSFHEKERKNSDSGSGSSGNFNSIKGYSEYITSSESKSSSALNVSHSYSNSQVPPNVSPTFRHTRRDSIVTPQDVPNIMAAVTPPPAAKKVKNSKVLVKARPIDLAKQLTLIEKDMFCKIACSDLIMAAWKKKDKAQKAPNVVRMIDWFNKLSSWAQTAVVATGSLRDRIAVLTKIIQVAEHCIELHNYSTGMSIVSGLKCSSVSRLARTWKGVGKRELAAWDTMSEIFDAQGNFASYRRLIHLAHGEPSLPYLGVVLQDLLMVEELPTFLHNKMVNFKKMRRFAGLVREEIQDRQVAAARYSFEVDPTVQEYFHLFTPFQDADLYKLSRVCEPATLA